MSKLRRVVEETELRWLRGESGTELRSGAIEAGRVGEDMEWTGCFGPSGFGFCTLGRYFIHSKA